MYDQLQLIGYPADLRLWRWNRGLEDGNKEIEHLLRRWLGLDQWSELLFVSISFHSKYMNPKQSTYVIGNLFYVTWKFATLAYW